MTGGKTSIGRANIPVINRCAVSGDLKPYVGNKSTDDKQGFTQWGNMAV